MAAKLLIDIPVVNWAYSVVLNPEQEYSFGTGNSNSIVLPSGSASRQHASIKHTSDWQIDDLGSESGTFVNGQAAQCQILAHNDVLKMGSCEAVFQNAAARASKDEWDHTHKVIEERQKMINDQSAVGGRFLEGAFLGRSSVGTTSDAAKVPSLSAKTEGDREAVAARDHSWIAEQLSSIISAVLSSPGSREETYQVMLQKIRSAIEADNGFVMIPSEDQSRWIIRAWVGDSAAWTQYEKSHPLPLTVTNRAYQTMSVVSNALSDERPGTEPINSSSMKALNVSSYIAVPLIQGNQRRGVLYFDRRNQTKDFVKRDVRLMEFAGNCILDIEDQKS